MMKLAEIAIAAPQVIAVRTSRMLAAGANPGASDPAEFSRMHTEKVAAYWESMAAMAAQVVKANQEYARLAGVQWLRLWTAPLSFVGKRTASQAAASLLPLPTPAQRRRAASSVLAAAVKPVHKRATANARRLKRKR
jgi:hypothetical protein